MKLPKKLNVNLIEIKNTQKLVKNMNYDNYIHTNIIALTELGETVNLQTSKLLHILPIQDNEENFYTIIHSLHSYGALELHDAFVSSIDDPIYTRFNILSTDIESRMIQYLEMNPLDPDSNNLQTTLKEGWHCRTKI